MGAPRRGGRMDGSGPNGAEWTRTTRARTPGKVRGKGKGKGKGKGRAVRAVKRGGRGPVRRPPNPPGLPKLPNPPGLPSPLSAPRLSSGPVLSGRRRGLPDP
ncbi:hypothetical protein BX268_3947 [Streptomyces sp. 2221.1]|nr:hypothetical protein BX268_3947 [Streptomyces sp. 2221.1]